MQSDELIRLAELENDPAVIYAVDRDMRLIYCNAAWDRFALENSGEDWLRDRSLSTDLMAVIPPPLRGFYCQAWAEVRRMGRPWDHEYECSSPGLLRRFHMHVTLLPGARDQVPLVVLNSLLVEKPHPNRPVGWDASLFLDKAGIITMCCHCRRTRLAFGQEEWVWAPFLVRALPENVSHGICPPCAQIHYGELAT